MPLLDPLQTASTNNPTPVALPLPAPLPVALPLPAPLPGASHSETLPVASPSWSALSTSPDVHENTV